MRPDLERRLSAAVERLAPLPVLAGTVREVARLADDPDAATDRVTILDSTGPDPLPDSLIQLVPAPDAERRRGGASHRHRGRERGRRTAGRAPSARPRRGPCLRQAAPWRLRSRGARRRTHLVEPPDGIEVLDTTGAGDAFAAALAVAIMNDLSPAAAAVDAVAAAPLAVSAVGAQPAMPDRAATARRVRVAMARWQRGYMS